MTSHPKDIDYGLIDIMAQYDNICNYIHLPVQAGSDILLRAMNRNYTVEQYLDIIDYAKMKLPGLSISTDLIIGFPGETEDDIAALIKFLKLVEYDSAYTFIYSQRKGTPADEMEDQIPEEIKHQRFNRVLEVLNEIIIRKNMALKGQTLEVLVDHYNEKDDNYVGRTEGNRTVHFKGTEDLIGNFVRVLITEPRKFSLQGEIIYV
jgi:tRNA-2-methylthio-N6-dimethylallyladenosine synthase